MQRSTRNFAERTVLLDRSSAPSAVCRPSSQKSKSTTSSCKSRPGTSRVDRNVDHPRAFRRRLLGVKTDDKKQTKVGKLTKGEILMINIGSTSTGGRVMSVKADLAKILLNQPACTEIGEKVALSRRIALHWRLVSQRVLAVLADGPANALPPGRVGFAHPVEVSLSRMLCCSRHDNAMQAVASRIPWPRIPIRALPCGVTDSIHRGCLTQCPEILDRIDQRRLRAVAICVRVAPRAAELVEVRRIVDGRPRSRLSAYLDCSSQPVERAFGLLPIEASWSIQQISAIGQQDYSRAHRP